MINEYDRRPIRVPPEIIVLPVSGRALRVLMTLFRFATPSLKVWASLESMLMYLPGWDRRSLKRELCELRDHPLSLLRVKHQRNEKTGATLKNTYTIHLPSLKKIREYRQRYPSARGGAYIAPLPGANFAPLPLNRTELTDKRELKEERLRGAVVDKSVSNAHGPRTSSFPSEKNGELQNIIDHWKAVHRAERKAPAPVYPRLRWILRDLMASEGIGQAGAKAAVDLWFKRAGKGAWEEKAYKHAYAPEAFERNIHSIVQSIRFTERRKKYE